MEEPRSPENDPIFTAAPSEERRVQRTITISLIVVATLVGMAAVGLGAAWLILRGSTKHPELVMLLLTGGYWWFILSGAAKQTRSWYPDAANQVFAAMHILIAIMLTIVTLSFVFKALGGWAGTA